MRVDSPQGTVPVHELERVWYRKGSRSWRGLAHRGALGLLMLGPLVAAGAALAVALLSDASAVNRTAIVLLAALLGLAAAPLLDLVLERFDRSYARGAHRYQIWGTWRGARVLLLETDDALRFGRTYRAIERVVERTPATRVPPAATRRPGPATRHPGPPPATRVDHDLSSDSSGILRR